MPAPGALAGTGRVNAGMASTTSRRAPLAPPDEALPPRRRWRRRVIVAVVVAVAAGTGAVVVVHDVFSGAGGANDAPDNGSATSLATVELRTLSAQMQVNGALGYAGSYTVLSQAQGTVTWLPEVGQIVQQGQALYQVDGAPVVLLYGSVPAYRILAEGTTGTDVAQLNHDLVALGYVKASDVDTAWDRYGWATDAGVTKLQKQLGVDQSGWLAMGEVVFLPTAARVVTLQAGLGAPATGAVLQASSTAPVVRVALTADRQAEVKAGDLVTITLPNGRTTPGTVTSVGGVATTPSNDSGGSGAASTVPVTIQPTDPAAIGGLDQAQVLVAITTATVQSALAVPVNALLATADGGYAVEIADPEGTRHLVSVSPGLFDDATGLVQVTGSGLSAGQRVVVPAS